MYTCQSVVPDQVTEGTTGATRGSQPPTQVGGILVYLYMAYYHIMLILSALPTIIACIPLALLHSV